MYMIFKHILYITFLISLEFIIFCTQLNCFKYFHQTRMILRDAFNKFPDFFFVQAFKIVVDS